MIRTLLRMKVKPGRERDVAAIFEERRFGERAMAMPGCLGVELSMIPGAGTMVSTALWASRQAYQGWLDSAGRADDIALLRPLLAEGPDAIGPSEICEILLASPHPLSGD